MKTKRAITWTILATVVAIALYLGMRPQLVLVETANATRGSLQVTIEEEGKTRVKDRYLVSAPVAGFVRRIELNIGDAVALADLMTELEPLRSDVLDPRRRAEAEARVAASRSALLSAEEQARAAGADADYSKSEYNRKKRLKPGSVISDEELDQAYTAAQRAQAVLRSAKFAVDVARYELDAASTLLKYSAAQDASNVLKERVPIRSPITGSVLKLHKESEGVVDAGTPLIELGDPTALEIAGDVLSFDAVRIRPGIEVMIKRWGGEDLTGIVRLVEPVGFTQVSALGVEEQRVWVIVDITSSADTWRSLGDGYRVEASFILWRQDNVLQVPESSLFKSNNGYALYVVNDGIAQRRDVTVGERNGLQAQITAGITVGEEVILHPDDDIADGVRVQQRL